MKHLLKWVAALASVPLLAFAVYLAVGLTRSLDPIPQFGTRSASILIRNVSVIDVADGKTLRDVTVTIADGTIVAIGKDIAVPAKRAVTIIDGRGKYLIPGLWDAHIHTLAVSDRLHFPLMLADGITSARNMGDGCSWSNDLECTPDRMEWQRSARSPRIVATASYHIEDLDRPADARALVRALKARGDDLVKIQIEDDPDASKFRAIVEASRSEGIKASGHVPPNIDLTDPAYAALQSIEHDTQLMPLCSSGAQSPCDRLLATLAARGTAYVPTHVASSGQDVALARRTPDQDQLLGFTNSSISILWRAYRFMHRSGLDQADLVEYRRQHETGLRLTRRAHLAGVPILAGTDALDPFVLHGPSLHDELAYLVRAGLSPLDALRAATVVPARLLGRSGETGRIEIGQRADLVLLTRNPLENIEATRSIETVVANGIIYAPEDRQRMRLFVKRQAASHAVGARSWWALFGFSAR